MTASRRRAQGGGADRPQAEDRQPPSEDLDAILTLLLSDELLPVAPASGSRERLLATVNSGVERFAPLVPAVARLLEVEAPAARSLLERIDDPSAWVPSPFEGIRVTLIPCGAASLGALAGLLWQPAGSVFALHEHLGEERLLVVEGSLADDRGARWEAGEGYVLGSGSRHAVFVPASGRCIAAFVSFGVRVL